MQTSHSLDPSVAGLAGDFYDTSCLQECVSAPASETIPFGVLVGLHTDGKARRWRTGDKVLGISKRRSTRESGLYAEGASADWKLYEEVPCVRKGRVWMQFESNAVGVRLAAPNMWGPSTDGLSNAAKRGFATSRVVDVDAGEEVTAMTGMLFYKSVAATDVVCVVELNLPA
jgi:hypothetical protein